MPGDGVDQAGPLVGPAVDGHQAVEAHADAAEQPARRPPTRVVRQRRTPAAMQRGADGLAGLERDRPSVERSNADAASVTPTPSARLGEPVRARSGVGSSPAARPAISSASSAAGRRGQADAGALVPAGVPEPGDPRVGADHRQMVRAVRPEAPVHPHQRDVGQQREQPHRLGGQPLHHVEPACRRSKPTRSRLAPISTVPPRVPSTTTEVSRPGVAGGDVGDVVGGVHLVPDHPRQRLGDQDEAAARQHRNRPARARSTRSPPQVPAALTTTSASTGPPLVRTPVRVAVRAVTAPVTSTPERIRPRAPAAPRSSAAAASTGCTCWSCG